MVQNLSTEKTILDDKSEIYGFKLLIFIDAKQYNNYRMVYINDLIKNKHKLSKGKLL